MTGQTEGLKPCPFCGGQAILWYGTGSNGELYSAGIECSKCQASVPQLWRSDLETAQAEVREAWNRRAQ